MGHSAILFDLDGTLVDSLGDIAAAANAAMRGLGQPTHAAADYRLMVGEGADVLVRRALPADQQHLAAEALAAFKAYYAEHPADQTVLYPGMAETLDAVRERGLPVAIVTNKPQRAAEQVAALLLGRWEWAAVAGHREGRAKKPDPAAALAAAEAADAAGDVARCLLVGDSRTDMLTAAAAGMIGVGVTWGYRDREELIAHGAAHLIDHPSELLDLL